MTDLGLFGSNPGALAARTYVPADLPTGAPLVVVLHGCTQTAVDADNDGGWSKLADRSGFALLFPEQRRTNNPNLCFNWFLPEDTRRGEGEALSIIEMIDGFAAAHNLDRKRIFVAGLSAGGAMALVLLATYPEIFAGGAIFAGLPYGTANGVREALDRMRGHAIPAEKELGDLVREASPGDGAWPVLSIWQGTADHVVSPLNAEAIAGQWREVQGLKLAPTRTEVGAGYSRQIWCDADGHDRIELYSITGMGHGLAVDQGDGETIGPYALEAGISSSQRVLSFWGLISPKPRGAVSSKPAERVGVKVPPAALATSGIGQTIRDALRSAGLLR